MVRRRSCAVSNHRPEIALNLLILRDAREAARSSG